MSESIIKLLARSTLPVAIKFPVKSIPLLTLRLPVTLILVDVSEIELAALRLILLLELLALIEILVSVPLINVLVCQKIFLLVSILIFSRAWM